MSATDKHQRFAAVGAATLVCAAVATSCSSDEPSAQDFARMFGGSSADYDPASSPSELADWSTVVVEGRLVEIIAGREHGRDADDPSLAMSVTMVVAVDQVLHGQADDLVYVEMPSPGNTPARDYKDVGAALPVVLYLNPAQHEPGIIIDESAGRPKDEPLFQLTNPQGMVIGGEESVTQILEFTTYPGASLEEFYPDRTQYPQKSDAPAGT